MFQKFIARVSIETTWQYVFRNKVKFSSYKSVINIGELLESLTSFSTLRIRGPTAKWLLTVVWSERMLTATSPVLLNEDKPYRVPLALGLLFSEPAFTLLLVATGFLVDLAGAFVLVGALVVLLAGALVGLALEGLGLVSGFCFVALASDATSGVVS